MNDLTAPGAQLPDETVGLARRRNLWDWITEPADAVVSPEGRREARLLAASLAVILPFTVIGTFAIVAAGTSDIRNSVVLGGTALGLAVAYILSRTERYRLGIYVALGTLFLVPYASVLVSGSIDPLALIWVTLTLVVSSVFLSMWGVAFVTVLNLIVMLLLPLLVADAGVADVLGQLGLTAVTGGAIMVSMRFRALQEQDRQAELTDRNLELEEARATLEQRVEERTSELSRRTAYLEATTAVSREAASLLDVDALLTQVSQLVSEQFGFYHTGVFLLDPEREWAVLEAASSEGGQRMLERDHRLRVGVGIVGHVVGLGEHRIALDVGGDAVYFDNPDLPETRSEMALPLRAGGQVIGALDVQSREAGAFSDEDVVVLQTLADQVALAIYNASLYQQAQTSLDAERRAYGELSREAWVDMIRSRQKPGYRYHERTVEPIDADGGQAESEPADLPELTLPVRYRDQVMGTIKAHKPADSSEWTSGEVQLMESLAEQLSLALDSARLHEDAQRRAMREALLGEIGARIRQTLDVDSVLRSVAQEARVALDLPEVNVRLARLPASEDQSGMEQS